MKILTILKWFMQTVPLEIFTLTGLILSPLAYYYPNTFNWYGDDEIFNPKTNEDFNIWLGSKKWNLWHYYRWHGLRNRMWNFRQKFKPEVGQLILTDVVIDKLYRNGNKAQTTDTAAYKWIDNGVEGWQVNSGQEISIKYSTIGTNYIFFKINGKRYFRYSTAREIKFFKTFYLNIKLGTNNKRNILTIKIQKK